MRLLKQMVNSERGQALVIVLTMLVLGGLTIAPALNYAATSLNIGQIIERGVSGIYAAEAGVEDTLWSLANTTTPSQQLAESINQMQVAIQTEDTGAYTLYLDELVQTEQHSDYLGVDGEMVWDEGAQAYKYTITVTWQPGSGVQIIHLVEVGVRLPIGYSYQSGSAAGFVDNLSTSEPNEILDESGAYMLNWELGTPSPYVSADIPVQTQTFYITGEGNQEGDYTWVVANREDIGTVSEITGILYQVTATATHPESGEITATVATDVLIDGGTIYIVSWQILK